MTGTERKTINKYYPPDYDPRRIPKGKYEPNRQYVIRVMAPFNMRCNTCGEYIYKGKKFNARRETVQDDDYLGLSLFRFYIRCPGCLAEITFKTDLKNCDYSQEHGATRLFEAEKLLREEEERERKQEEEDKINPMKMLEMRTKMSRFEMEALERIEELKEMNVRQAKPDYEQLIGDVTKERQLALKRQEQEDEEFVNAVFGKTPDGKFIKRLLDSDEDECATSSNHSTPSNEVDRKAKEKDQTTRKKQKLSDQKALLGVVKKKVAVEAEQTNKGAVLQLAVPPVGTKNDMAKLDAPTTANANALKLLVSYGSGSESDSS